MKKQFMIRILTSLLAVAGLVWFFIPFHWGVVNVGNLTGIAICLPILLVSIFYPWIKKRCGVSKGARIFCRTVSAVFCAGLIWAAFLTGLMIFGIHTSPPKEATVVVLGSKVSGHTPSADLRVRIDAAASYLLANPQAKCIVSGGQGTAELATEAAVMKEYLVKQGIDALRITTEEQSTNTQENLANSLTIIDKAGMSRQLAIVTDEYHQFRAGKIAERLGAVPYSVCATTPWYIFSACYMRELLALTKFLIFP